MGALKPLVVACSWAPHVEHLADLIAEVSAMPALQVDPTAVYLTGVVSHQPPNLPAARTLAELRAGLTPCC